MARTHTPVALDPMSGNDAQGLAARALDAIASAVATDRPLVIYSTAEPAQVAAVARLGHAQASSFIAKAFATLAATLVERGVRRLVVAGGERSGAVVQALGIKVLRIGLQVDPGASIGPPSIALALKSGNFAAEDSFLKSPAMLP